MVHVQREVAINSCDLSGLFATSIATQPRVPLKAQLEPFLSSAIRAFSRTLLMSLDEPFRRSERVSRSSAAMGRAQCITATPRKRGLHSFKVLEDHRQPAASDRRTTKATFSSRHFRPRWRRL